MIHPTGDTTYHAGRFDQMLSLNAVRLNIDVFHFGRWGGRYFGWVTASPVRQGWLRDQVKYPTIELLKEQLARDIAMAR